MDLDSDSSRCKGINGVWVRKGLVFYDICGCGQWSLNTILFVYNFGVEMILHSVKGACFPLPAWVGFTAICFMVDKTQNLLGKLPWKIVVETCDLSSLRGSMNFAENH
jgi:hypothetical protein